MKALLFEFLKCTLLSIQVRSWLIVATDGETLLNVTNANEKLTPQAPQAGEVFVCFLLFRNVSDLHKYKVLYGGPLFKKKER